MILKLYHILRFFPSHAGVKVSIRLAGGNGVSNGQVEIGFNEQFWGGICHSGWGYVEATILCKMKGFEKGLPTFGSTFGSGVDRVWLNNVNCVGEEKSILDCAHSAWNTICADYDYHAGVICLGKQIFIYWPTKQSADNVLFI